MSAAMAPVYWALAGLLALAGAAKLAAPSGAERALSAAGVPLPQLTARAAGALELALGALCLAWPTALAALALSLAYLSFAAFVLRLRAAGASDCGCFGAGSFEPTRAHAAMNVVAGLAAAGAAVAGPRGIGMALAGSPLTAAALLAGSAAAALLAFALFTEAPRAWRAWEGGADGR